MWASLPHLDLIQYKAEEVLQNSESYKEAMKEAQKKYKWPLHPDYDLTMFKQTWPTGALGFDTAGGLTTQAFTDAYTVVVHETYTDHYVIFFGDDPAYTVHDPTEDFINDLRNHDLKGQRGAGEFY